MSVTQINKRLQLICGLLGRKSYPSLQDIQGYLEEELDDSISIRTIQRSIEDLRHQFNIEIRFDAFKRGYFIDPESENSVGSLLKWVSLTSQGDFINKILKGGDELSQLALQDESFAAEGMQYLEPLLGACREKMCVHLEYQRFEAKGPKAYELHPHFLKEYLHRWYLIAWSAEHKDFRTFALDRIQKIVPLNKTFKKKADQELRQKLEQTIGINPGDGKAHLILIKVERSAAGYIRTQPFHASQFIDKETEDYVIFGFKAVLNYELSSRLLMMGDALVVLEPKELVSDLKKRIKKMLQHYQ